MSTASGFWSRALSLSSGCGGDETLDRHDNLDPGHGSLVPTEPQPQPTTPSLPPLIPMQEQSFEIPMKYEGPAVPTDYSHSFLDQGRHYNFIDPGSNNNVLSQGFKTSGFDKYNQSSMYDGSTIGCHYYQPRSGNENHYEFSTSTPTTIVETGFYSHGINNSSVPQISHQEDQRTEELPLNLTSMKQHENFDTARSSTDTSAGFYPYYSYQGSSSMNGMQSYEDHYTKPGLGVSEDVIPKKTKEYLMKRERNNIAVRKSREKAKRKYLELQEKERELEEINHRLVRKIEGISAEVDKMRAMYIQMKDAGLIQ